MDHLAHVAAFALGCLIGLPLLVLINRFTKTKDSRPRPLSELTREYEWRSLGTGAIDRTYPGGAEVNGCVAWLKAWAEAHKKGIFTGRTAEDEKRDPKRVNALGLYVVATGERVAVDGRAGSHAQLSDSPDLPCFNLAGRTIKKPEST